MYLDRGKKGVEYNDNCTGRKKPTSRNSALIVVSWSPQASALITSHCKDFNDQTVTSYSVLKAIQVGTNKRICTITLHFRKRAG